MMVTLAFFGHPHPLIRLVVGVLFLGTLCVLMGAMIYARHRRHVELSARLKSLEEKLDRLAAPPSPPAAK